MTEPDNRTSNGPALRTRRRDDPGSLRGAPHLVFPPTVTRETPPYSTWRCPITFENTAKGRPAVFTPTDMDLETAVEGLIGRLHDSLSGLRTAAELVEDESLTRFIAGILERRRASLDAVVAVAADTGLHGAADSTGTLSEAVRRGWMRLKDSLTDDDAEVVETAISEERDLADEIAGLLRRDLPEPLADELRCLADETESDLARLAEWKTSVDAGEPR